MKRFSVRPALTMKGRTFKGLRGWSGIAVLSVVIALLVSVGATFGGSLVYDYGFNVETAGDHPVWHRSENDVFPGQRD
jgi:hypothetical protein